MITIKKPIELCAPKTLVISRVNKSSDILCFAVIVAYRSVFVCVFAATIIDEWTSCNFVCALLLWPVSNILHVMGLVNCGVNVFSRVMNKLLLSYGGNI